MSTAWLHHQGGEKQKEEPEINARKNQRTTPMLQFATHSRRHKVHNRNSEADQKDNLSTLCLILYVSEAVEIELQVTASQETTDKLTQVEQHGGQCYQ